jgi:hypothetical protein
MNENDTFNKLKRTPFIDIFNEYYKGAINRSVRPAYQSHFYKNMRDKCDNSFFKSYGWNREDLLNEALKKSNYE